MSISSAPSVSYSPHAEIVSAMNAITDRWQSVHSRQAIGQQAQLHSKVDPELRAVNDFYRGSVPEQGSNVVELIGKMTF